MASIDDRWYRRGAQGKVEPTARHGRGKRWRVRYIDPSGRERGKSFARKADAEKFKATTEADLIRGKWADPDAGRILLGDYARDWLAGRNGEPSTMEILRNRIEKHIIPALGQVRLADLRASRIQSFITGLPLGPGSARGVLTTLRAILTAAADDDLIPSNPARKASVKVPKIADRRVIPWTGAQVAAIRAGMPERWKAFVDLGAGCGMRQGEILGLDLRMVDMLRHVVHVRQQLRVHAGTLVLASPKGGKERDVPLPEQTALAIAAHLARFPACEVELPWRTPGGPKRTALLLFTTHAGKAINRGTFNDGWREGVRSAGMTPARGDTGTHQLRHRYASVLLAGGVDIKTLSAYLGHGSAAFTLSVYTHLLASADDRARKVIEAALAADEIADGPGRDQEAGNPR